MKDVILLDGGLGQEIYKRAQIPAHPLWSVKVMMDQPDIVKSVHQDFIKAGAQIITVNSYSCTPTRLQRDGHLEWFEDLQQLALKLARESRDEMGASAAKVQLAGCLPPLIGSYANDDRSFQQLKEEYSKISAIQAPEVDLFIIETITNEKEARAAVEAALETGKPVMVSYTLSDEQPGKLRSGELLEEAVNALARYPLSGLMFNCSFPETIAQGMERIKHLAIPYGGYANGFTSVKPLKLGGTVDALTARTDLDEKKMAQHALDWIQKGASIVGGCCEVGPSHIEHLYQALVAEGYKVVSLQ